LSRQILERSSPRILRLRLGLRLGLGLRSSLASPSPLAFQDFSSCPKFGIIIQDHQSKSYNAPFLVQNLSKFVIAFLKKNRGGKNKFQQLKNIASKILVKATCASPGAPALYERLEHSGEGTLLSLSGPHSCDSVCSIFHRGLVSQGARRRKQNHGVAFRFAGRAYGAKKAASFKTLVGSIPFNTVCVNMDYAQVTQKTRNGT
jgi:hypothetical protein